MKWARLPARQIAGSRTKRLGLSSVSIKRSYAGMPRNQINRTAMKVNVGWFRVAPFSVAMVIKELEYEHHSRYRSLSRHRSRSRLQIFLHVSRVVNAAAPSGTSQRRVRPTFDDALSFLLISFLRWKSPTSCFQFFQLPPFSRSKNCGLLSN